MTRDLTKRAFAKALIEDGWRPIIGGLWYQNAQRPGESVGARIFRSSGIHYRETLCHLRAEKAKWDEEDYQAQRAVAVQP